MRRCLGPVGGSVAFVLVAGLVFTGLGWVTVTALRVEEAQRAAAADAAVANKLRLALWRLDGRLLPALGAENARTFLEYAPPDQNSAYGPTCAPLLAGPLHDWMKLHAQLDPELGWSSPQVLTPEAAELFALAWPELKPTNATPDRARALDALGRRHQFRSAYAAFAARDGLSPLPESPRRATDGAPAKMLPPPALGAAAVGPAVLVDAPKELEKIAPAPRVKDANVAPVFAPAPPPRPAPTPVAAVDNTLRQQDRGDAGADAQARRRVAELAAGARQPESYIYPPANYRNGIEPQSQNTIVVGRNQLPTTPADRDSKGVKAEEKAANGTASFGVLKADPAASAPRGEGAQLRFTPPPPSLFGLADLFTRGLSGGSKKESQNGESARLMDDTKSMAAKLARLNGTPDPRGYGPGGSPSGGIPGGGGGFSGGGFGSPSPTSGPPQGFNGGVAPPGPPAGFAGQLPKAQTGSDNRDKADAVASRGGANDPKAKMSPAAPAAPPAGPPVAGLPAGGPMAAAPPPPAPAAVPQPPTPEPVPPPLLPPAEPVPPADNLPAPVVMFNLPAVAVHLGPIRSQWLPAADGKDTLVLVRTARLDNRTVYQGVVIDWERLQDVLRKDVEDLFPEATLVPVKVGEGAPDRAMTALPVVLEPGPAAADPHETWTPLRMGLALAWAAALLAFGAVGLAGWSLIDLSERRIRFVSAVTHELRTPLTSLRLYLDLLLSGMVQDEQKRTEYLSTLAVESDRLHRLVDNVLDFARLERRRGGAPLQPAKVADLLTAVRDTWTDRCGTDGKELIVVSTLPPEAEVTTDAALVGQIVGNLIDNARKYTRSATDPRVWVWAKPEGRKVVFEVEDRGPGVPPREQKIIFRPFRRGETADTTAGGAGLGLALCKQWAESLGGTLGYRPADGDTGACFRLELPGVWVVPIPTPTLYSNSYPHSREPDDGQAVRDSGGVGGGGRRGDVRRLPPPRPEPLPAERLRGDEGAVLHRAAGGGRVGRPRGVPGVARDGGRAVLRDRGPGLLRHGEPGRRAGRGRRPGRGALSFFPAACGLAAPPLRRKRRGYARIPFRSGSSSAATSVASAVT